MIGLALKWSKRRAKMSKFKISVQNKLWSSVCLFKCLAKNTNQNRRNGIVYKWGKPYNLKKISKHETINDACFVAMPPVECKVTTSKRVRVSTSAKLVLLQLWNYLNYSGIAYTSPNTWTLVGAFVEIEKLAFRSAGVRRLHTESGYGLRSGLWPTAIFTQARLAVSGWIFSVSTGFRLT